jgi:hypothetical protein
MLQHFHDTGSSYLWEFLDPVGNGATGYSRFRFSYASRLPESIGRRVLFEGISCFRFPAERIRRILDRAAAAQNQPPEARRHLDRLSSGRGA